MSTPSPKRRKISPTTSTSVDPSLVDDVRRTPVRASFMSPTKASLARFNPNLLPRPPLADFGVPSPHRRGSMTAKSHQGRADVLGDAGAPVPAPLDNEGDGALTGVDLGPATDDQTAGGASSTVADPVQRTVDQQIAVELFQASSSPLRPSGNQRAKDRPSDLPDPNRESPATVGAMRDAATGQSAHAQSAADYAATVAKEQQKNRLLQDLNTLEAEVKRFEHHTERSQRLDTTEEDDANDLVSLLKTYDYSQPVSPKAHPISQLLTSFLPFAKPQPASPPAIAPLSVEKPVPSHLPVALDDPLPYLRLFTPFNVTSTVGLPTSPGFAGAMQQLHTITMHSPSHLLTAKLELTISNPAPLTENTSPTSTHWPSPTVEALRIVYLSTWAAREIGSWLHERTKERDIGAVCWALGSYWDVSAKRAECWMRCEKAFPDLMGLRGVAPISADGKADPPQPAAERRKQSRPRERPLDAGGRDDEAEPEHEEVSGIGLDISAGPGSLAGKGRSGLQRKDLFRQLGRSVLVFESQEVVLRISWYIRFDWTGEAESVVSAAAAFPSAWQEADERRSLKRIAETFDRLVRDRGVFGGIKVMVGLLFES